MDGILKQLDKEENWSVPRVRLSMDEFDFGVVQFMETRSLSFNITNTCNGVVEFVFTPKVGEKELCAPWYRVSPTSGCIRVEESVEVIIALCVDKCSVAMATGTLPVGRKVVGLILD